MLIYIRYFDEICLHEKYTQKKVSLNQTNLCIVMGSKKSFFESKKFVDCFFSLNWRNKCLRSRIVYTWLTEIFSLIERKNSSAVFWTTFLTEVLIWLFFSMRTWNLAALVISWSKCAIARGKGGPGRSPGGSLGGGAPRLKKKTLEIEIITFHQ